MNKLHTKKVFSIYIFLLFCYLFKQRNNPALYVTILMNRKVYFVQRRQTQKEAFYMQRMEKRAIV